LGGGGLKKPWGKSNWGFPCCWGTLSEQLAKLSDSIYFRSPDGDTLFVNLFVASAEHWPERGLVVTQESAFPVAMPTAKLTIAAAGTRTSRSGGAHAASAAYQRGARARAGAAETFTLKIRVPAWAAGKNTATVNGLPVQSHERGGGDSGSGSGGVKPGTYLSIARAWAPGDVVELALETTLWASPLNDDRPQWEGVVAFMYGPLVLAGLTDSDHFLPKGGPDNALRPWEFIARSSSTALEFTATASNSNATTRLVPLYQVNDEQYAVYFYTTTAAAATTPPPLRAPPTRTDPHAHAHAHAHAYPHASPLAMPPSGPPA